MLTDNTRFTTFFLLFGVVLLPDWESRLISMSSSCLINFGSSYNIYTEYLNT